ncbi:hydrogenase maturation protease [Phormidium sp. LEGE 05292]|uniref:hydrogenase maturation protease n=1 Tax=[Phormidium] sp. LEGE 05292 TaxID=767427 RepID=UPI00187F5F08|nr:hydrogenase maturation protease [Phormidium sp. LEGE 05292]MBE9225049.1 hydrogenase maturation protease [Phormidium sp. LEGE 05292]
MNSHLSITLQTLDKSFIVIGYGNDLRSDDGIGPRVANEVEAWGLPNVKSLALHQLTPEIADTIKDVDGVIFVDACQLPDVQEVQVLTIEAEETGKSMTHNVDPRSLLALSQTLYNHHPHAWCINVPAVNFEMGETLSSVAEKGVVEALEKINFILLEQTHHHEY